MRSRTAHLLPAILTAALALPACGDKPEDTATGGGGDLDGDGITAADGDCDDGDPTVYPGATDSDVDGTDQDCDGFDGPDADADGFADAAAGGDDCDDSDPTAYPGADDSDVDGSDQDCDGFDGPDADADGFADAAAGGDDCDDTDATINPGTTETWYDGVDSDCDGASDFDADSDGFDSADHEGDDCDDTLDSVYPGAPEDFTDGIDQDCDGRADRAASVCTATFDLTLTDGTVVTLDACEEWNLDAAFEFDPDDPPEVVAFELELDASSDAGFECKVTLSQDQVCGTGFYRQGDEEAGQATVITLDCSGVPDDDEGTFSAVGYLDLTDIDTGGVAGSFVGDPLYTGLAGRLALDFGTLSLAGTFDVAAEQIADDEEEQTVCAVSDGDDDNDGYNDWFYDGTDCDDDDATAFPGAATAEPTLCTHDTDSDGFGDSAAVAPLDAGTDCDDDDATAFPGVATAEPTLCTHDTDSDGYGDSAAVAPLDAGTDCDDDDATAFPGVATAEPTLCTHDADADGYGDSAASAHLDAGTDCDDGDATAYPGVATAEPGICTHDADGDGYGDIAASAPLTAGTDCNDGEATEFPGAVAEASATECMFDSDGDGFGDLTATAPYDAGTDCDDGDATAYPGVATAEPGICTHDADGDGYGDEDALSPLTAGSDCDDGEPTTSPGAPEVCGDGIDNNCDGAPNGCGLSEDVDAEMADMVLLGARIVRFGDIDGDGVNDSVTTATDDCSETETFSVLYGPLSAIIDTTASADATRTAGPDSACIGSTAEGDTVNIIVTDIDNDGYDDVISQSLQTDWSTDFGGGVYINYGPLTGTTTLASSDAIIEGSNTDWAAFEAVYPDPAYHDILQTSFIGNTISVFPDIDGDGLDDLFVGGGSGAVSGEYEAYVFTGVLSGTVQLTDAVAMVTVTADSISGGPRWGGPNQILGDTDGDGVTDGITLVDEEFATWSLQDQDDHIDELGSFGTRGTNIYGTAATGDVDSDGYDDLMVIYGGFVGIAGVGIHTGSSSGLDSAAVGTVTAAQYRYTTSSSWYQHSAQVVGDINDDGFEDLVVGDYIWATGNEYNIYHGPLSPGTWTPSDASIVVQGEAGEGYVPRLHRHTDVNNDGIHDLVAEDAFAYFTVADAWVFYGGGGW